MNSKQRIGLAIGGGVLALAAAVGAGALAANLANGGADQPRHGSYDQNPGGPNQGQGNRTGRPGGRFDTTTMAKSLAAKLGVDEAKMKTALDNALQAARPADQGNRPSYQGTPGAAPSGAPGRNGQSDTWRTTLLPAMAKSIATELKLEEATVLAALQEVWPSSFPGRPGEQPSGQPS